MNRQALKPKAQKQETVLGTLLSQRVLMRPRKGKDVNT